MSTEREGPKKWNVDAAESLVYELRSIAGAYSESVFPPLTDELRAEYASTGIIDRASASMGRHLARYLTEAADAIEQANSKFRAATEAVNLAVATEGEQEKQAILRAAQEALK